MHPEPQIEERATLSRLEQQRLEKLERIRTRGIDPYPARSRRSHSAAEAIRAFEAMEAAGSQASGEEAPPVQPAPDSLPARTGAAQAERVQVALAGRLMSVRVMGGATFAHLMDGTGRIQIYLRRDELGEESYNFFRRDLDIGDFIGVSGTLFRTRTGEVTLRVRDFQLLAKSLSPLPEKWHGLRDVETRYRQRYLDLIANQEVRRIFLIRSQVISAMRRFLDGQGFIEVETPILQPLYGGATARPFETYHNVLDRTLYLRIADELYLKRLIIGGFDKVYEISKDFRNEGISTKHNPEFTMMECYQAYADYYDMMHLVEEMLAFIARQVLGTTQIRYQGHDVDLTPPWRRLTIRQALLDATGVDIEVDRTLEALWGRVCELNLAVEPQPTWGKLVDELLSTFVEPNLIQPTFIMDYPVEISPLAKKKPDAPHLVERFEPFAGGLELGNAFTELNDPLDQRERFLAQAKQRAAGDEEAQPLDEDFIQAMMYGMPPTGGLGIGVDRLVMLLTDQTSIREVILFPQLRT